jgi:rhodanese-related sulfurtransferase
VEKALAALGPQPPNFKAVVALNRGPLVTAGVEVGPLAPRQVEQKRREGALLVDVRTDLQFDGAHIPDAVAITTLHAGFGTKLAWVADRDQEIVFVGRDDQDGSRAATLAVAVGIRKLAGYLAGGMTAWRDERREVASIERVSAADLQERAEAEPALQILDVRERDEWADGHIPGSLHLPYHDIHSLPGGLDPERPVAVMCASGQRAAVAASMVARLGADKVLHVVDGGMGTWRRAGHPVERGMEGAAPA